MPYEPLHHKYRPQIFAELVGQEAIAATLSNALEQQRIAPAYLFTGPRGTGKTSSARILAKSLNCMAAGKPTPTPCGKCETCRTITRGSALDVIEIDAASNTGVDNIRDLIDKAQFAPVQCPYKVYVIDEVHMLSVAAFNALLKTLEEPPDRVVFILATTDPQKVLPTIISRCQRFDFRRIPLDAMVGHLSAIASKETINIAPDAVQIVAQIAQGGLRDAESLLDQLSLLSGEISVERVWDLVGAVPERELLALVKAIAQDDPIGVLERTRALMDRGREPLIVLQNLAGFYRDLLIAKTSPGSYGLVALTQPTWAELCEFSKTVDLPFILAGQQYLRSSEAQVKNSTQPRLWLEVALMGLLPSAIAAQSFGNNEAPRSREAIPGATLPQRSIPAAPTPQVSGAPTPHVSGAPTPHVSGAPTPHVSGAPPASVPSPTPPQPTPAQTTLPAPAPSPQPAPARAPQTPSPQTSEAPAPASLPPQPAPEPVAAGATVQQVWQSVMSLVQPVSTQILLKQQCHLIDFNGREARIGISSQPLFKMAKERMPNVEKAFEQYFSQKIRISLEVATPAEMPPTSVSETPSVYTPQPSQSTSAAAQPAPMMRSPQPVTAGSNGAASNGAASNGANGAGSNGAATKAPSPVAPVATAASAPPLATLSPPPEAEAPPQPYWQNEDDVLRAARSLAQMFNGQVVSMEEEVEASPAAEFAPDPDLEEGELRGEADRDVPF